ncbi:MAG TPA: hypothetical protein VJ717_03120 [Gemmatimonadaceae bacterium]|nr:hypothetical protein [Gemmatimonadaceae bacterium]
MMELTSEQAMIVSAHIAGRRVWIRYARPHGLYLRGPVTGEPYVFNAGYGTLVDVGDALALLETGLFERD